jgi:hypothetical protein
MMWRLLQAGCCKATYLNKGRPLGVANQRLAEASRQHAQQLVQVILHNHLLWLQLLRLFLGLRVCRGECMSQSGLFESGSITQ